MSILCYIICTIVVDYYVIYLLSIQNIFQIKYVRTMYEYLNQLCKLVMIINY